MRDLFLQQRRRPDGDRCASAPVRGGARGATRSALSFVAVVAARLARPGDGRGSNAEARRPTLWAPPGCPARLVEGQVLFKSAGAQPSQR